MFAYGLFSINQGLNTNKRFAKFKKMIYLCNIPYYIRALY